MSAPCPVGVFDSGLGGLTVLRRIHERIPGLRAIYLADQAHVPYGGRALPEVRCFATAIVRALVEAGCGAVVMACNISSAVLGNDLREDYPGVPILGVLRPGSSAAAALTGSGRVGVLATAGTVASGAYTRALHALAPTLEVTEVACPQFVPLVEAGRLHGADAHAAAREYLAPIRTAGADVVILGCTHYPLLRCVLEETAPELTFVDPAEAAAEQLATLVPASAVPAAPDLWLTTGPVEAFERQVREMRLAGGANPDFASATWRNGAVELGEGSG